MLFISYPLKTNKVFMPLITAIEGMLFTDRFPLEHLSLASIAPQDLARHCKNFGGMGKFSTFGGSAKAAKR
jgi:hypothetical protein